MEVEAQNSRMIECEEKVKSKYIYSSWNLVMLTDSLHGICPRASISKSSVE